MNTSCKIDKIRIPLNILKNNISLSFCIFQSILDSFVDLGETHLYNKKINSIQSFYTSEIPY